jgi:hypothetical protein
MTENLEHKANASSSTLQLLTTSLIFTGVREPKGFSFPPSFH